MYLLLVTTFMVEFLNIILVFHLQLYMEDICKKSLEYGINLWLLEKIEQGAKVGKGEIHPYVL